MNLRPPQSTETQGEEPSRQPLLRVAALPGAERWILRKRLERPVKVIRIRQRDARSASR